MYTSETRTLRPKPYGYIGLLAGSLAFVCLGAWMVFDKEWSGWLIMGFFGLCSFVAVICILPGATYLKLDSEGFTMCTMFRPHTFKWSEVSDFGVGQIFGNEMVLMNFSESYKASASLRKFNTSVVGADGALPDSYGMKPEDLADLMNTYLASSHAA